ncbi:MAG: hypothetical protein ACR2OU_17885, partial [Thermomicrobiales bacterium]
TKMNTYSPAPTSTVRDFASRGVPIILGIGVAALVFLPNLSGGTTSNDQGDTVAQQASFSDVRKIMALTGYDWVYILAFAGLIAAAAAAIFLQRPNTNLPRKAIIIVGSLLGLVLPILFPFALISFADQVTRASWWTMSSSGGVSYGDGISVFTFGFYIFIPACVVAAIMGMKSENEATIAHQSATLESTGTSLQSITAPIENPTVAPTGYVRTTIQTGLMRSPFPGSNEVTTLPEGQRLNILDTQLTACHATLGSAFTTKPPASLGSWRKPVPDRRLRLKYDAL